MTAAELLAWAKQIARRAHKGQVDLGGNPYIGHPLRVMEAVRGEGVEAMVAAVLHDVAEDAPGELEHCRRLGFPESVMHLVEQLTKQGHEKGSEEGYARFIERIATSGSRTAIIVKLADLEDNLRLERLGRNPRPEDLARAEKYRRARAVLQKALERLSQPG